MTPLETIGAYALVVGILLVQGSISTQGRVLTPLEIMGAAALIIGIAAVLGLVFGVIEIAFDDRFRH